MNLRNNFLRLFVLICIIVVAGFLRLYKISANPPSLTWDEVSIGYNAYSIAKTGRDEHGKFLPLDAFMAYGDFKPPLAVYTAVPFVAAFGLNELSVRLSSALAGVATVILVYVLAIHLMPGAYVLSVLTSVGLAVSPWHIQLSRAGFEANVGVLFVVLGALLVIKTIKNADFWYIAMLPFVAAIYTFNSARYFSPFLVLGLLVYVRLFHKIRVKQFAIGAVICLLLLLPISAHLFSKEARLRFTEVNIFTDPSIVLKSNDRMKQDDQSFIGRIVHNRRIGYARSYLIHFFDHFDPQFLFIRGDGNPKFSVQDVGQLYMIEFPFLIAGTYFVLSRYRREGLLLLFWLVAAVVPAAVARETPHALRIENSLPVWYLFIAGGIVWSIEIVKRVIFKQMLSFLIFFLYVGSLSYFLHNYFVHYPKEFSGEWQYGYREAIRFIEPLKGKYEHIYLTESIGRAYMYVLFYEKANPEHFWQKKKSYVDAVGFYHVDEYDKYKFVGNESPIFAAESLYILPPGLAPKNAHKLQTIYKLNGEPVLEIFDI